MCMHFCIRIKRLRKQVSNMKKSVILLFLMCLVLAFSACSTGSPPSDVPSQSDNVETSDVSDSAQTEEVPEEDIVVPIYAEQLKDGSYLITVDSSSSMFRVVKCELIVENGAMSAVMTMHQARLVPVHQARQQRHQGVYRWRLPVGCRDVEQCRRGDGTAPAGLLP